MLRRAPLFAVLLSLSAAGAAAAQAVPQLVPGGVQVTTLAAPDAFTTPGRATGLPPNLWTGASIKTARTVMGLLSAKPLSPAAAQLARRVLATGAPGPEGAGDPALAAERANALSFQGDPKAAAAILARAPGVDRSPELARAVAEIALLAGDDARACAAAQGLAAGREETYWLRLRTYCQAIAGQTAQAQLTFDLAQAQAKDPVFGRLMGAKLAGAGARGPASLRNGLDLALSRSLGLDLATAKASPAVAAAMAAGDPAASVYDPAAAAPDFAPMAQVIASGKPIAYGPLMEAINAAKPGLTARAQAGFLLVFALDDAVSIQARDQLTAFTLAEGKAPVGRDLALEAAANRRFMGETAMLALWTCVEAGPGGPAIGDRVRIVHALHLAGLDADARAFALEGLIGLK